jgi:hypothetical protein
MICTDGHDGQLYELSGAEFNSISIVIEKRVREGRTLQDRVRTDEHHSSIKGRRERVH